MLGKLEVIINEAGGMEFEVNMPDVYLIKTIASLEEYMASQLNISVDEIRDIADDEKQHLQAKKK